LIEEVNVGALGDRSFARTVEEMPRSIIRDANAWRIEWNETACSPASFAATSKPRPIALRLASGRPDFDLEARGVH
jgi:hypothetical protein